MKEIKYRAWHKEKEMLVELLGISFKEKQVRLPIDSELSDEYWWDETYWDLDEVELMQFTGLKDKNGKEIYEGDILYDEHYDEYGVVTFEEGKFLCECDTFLDDLWEVCDDMAVIDNICENPELIEADQ